MEGAMTGISRRAFVTATGLAAAGTVLTACTSDDKKPASSTNSKVDKVTYLTTLGNLGRDSFIHAAVKNGYFKEVGIEVTVQYGQAGDYNNQQVLAGKVHFATVDCSGAIIRAGRNAKPQDRDVRIIGAVSQLNLNALAAWEDSGITSPKDFKNRKIGAIVGAAPKTLFPAYAQLAGIDTSGIKWNETTAALSPTLLVTRQVDALVTFNVAVPGFEEAASGRKAVIFPYSEYLADLYGVVAVTHKDLIASNPDLVRRFVHALMRGVLYSVEHPKETGDMLNAVDKAQSAGLATKELTLLKPYTIPGGGAPVGTLDETRIAKSIALLQGLGLMPGGLTPGDIMDTRFVPKSNS
jgi:NitT/TauT family transport system substrate-binding protein